MKTFRADMHIHTVLSPCGALEMSPINIIQRAVECKLDIIGITDHNSSLNAPLCRRLGDKMGIFVLTGVEVTTKEEVHCLVFFEDDEKLNLFQEILDKRMMKIPNKEEKFGYQLVVDENENIVRRIEHLLIAATDFSINELRNEVSRLGGIFIPAHIDRQRYSLISQLGFIPDDLDADAYELSRHALVNGFADKIKEQSPYTFITSGDAHSLDEIGSSLCTFKMKEALFSEVQKALKGQDERSVSI